MRIALSFLLLIQSVVLLFAASVSAQVGACGFDPQAPTLEHAKELMVGLNLDCAEQEVTSFMSIGNKPPEEMANAHILLAAVYYTQLRRKDVKITSNLQQAFRIMPDWDGTSPLKRAEFLDMLEEAERTVQADIESDRQRQATEDSIRIAQEQADSIRAVYEADSLATIAASEEGSKHWYKKWWAIASGVGVVAIAVGVALAGGGGGGDDGTTGQLPDFPDPPGGAR